jgi:hypothetical protein
MRKHSITETIGNIYDDEGEYWTWMDEKPIDNTGYAHCWLLEEEFQEVKTMKPIPIYKSAADIGRRFMRCENPKSSLLVERLDPSIVEEAVNRYFAGQITDSGKAKARFLHLYYHPTDPNKKVTIGQLAGEINYSVDSLKKFHVPALSEIVAYIPSQY